MRQNSLLLRRNSVQGLFNGYYHDDNIAASTGNKNQNSVIEEHVPAVVGPSMNSSTTHEPSSSVNSNSVVKKDGENTAHNS